MLIIPPECLMDEDQLLRWERIRDAILKLEAESDPIDPWLFHGTGQVNAISIIDNGFDPNRSYTRVHDNEDGQIDGDLVNGVYWTRHLETAENFASRRSSIENGFPVIFVAKASDLARSGRLIPDYNAWEIDAHYAADMKPFGWRDSLQKLGSVLVAGCHRVQNLKFYCPAVIEHTPEPDIYERNLKSYIDNLRPAALDAEASYSDDHNPPKL